MLRRRLLLFSVAKKYDMWDIGGPGAGLGVIPPKYLAGSGLSPMSGYDDPYHDNAGSYQFTEGSVMRWSPVAFVKWGTGLNGLPVNVPDIQPWSRFGSVAAANAAGYALPRCFIDGGIIQPGFASDAFQWSANGGIASSIKNGNPLSSSSAHNGWGSLLTGLTTADNIYGGAFKAAKTRGANFFPMPRYQFAWLATVAAAHAYKSTSTKYCAWYDAAGTTNFPKGNNNNALHDANDASVVYTNDGYSNCGKTGSGSPFAKTTHNGQSCGVADLNGNMWEVTPGLTSDGSNYYALKSSVRLRDVTGGTSLATDAWGPAGLAALYDNVGATFGAAGTNLALPGQLFGSGTLQVLSEAVSGNNWVLAGLGMALAGSVSAGGIALFGNDYAYDGRPNLLCPLSGGGWSDGASAGVWALSLYGTRAYSSSAVGGRSGLYLL